MKRKAAAAKKAEAAKRRNRARSCSCSCKPPRRSEKASKTESGSSNLKLSPTEHLEMAKKAFGLTNSDMTKSSGGCNCGNNKAQIGAKQVNQFDLS